MKTILLVCTGNLCRSPMAEGLLEKILRDKKAGDIRVFSSGINPPDGAPPTDDAIEVMQKRGIDISGHRAVLIGRDLIADAGLILVMGSRHRDKVLGLDPTARNKVFLLKEFAGEGEFDVADPVGQPPSVYEKCADEIKGMLEKALPKIIKFCEGNK